MQHKIQMAEKYIFFDLLKILFVEINWHTTVGEAVGQNIPH